MDKKLSIWATLISLSALISFFGCEQSKNVRRPNILICISDDQSFPHAGAYGCQWVNTPVFDRVASNGLLFQRAYTPDAKCAPSRSALLTGRNPWQLEEAVNHVPFFPEGYETFPEVLERGGYHVGYTGKGWGPGNPGLKGGVKRKLAGREYNQAKRVPITTGISNIDYVSNFRQFLSSKKEGTPFCFWFGAKEPHRPYEFKSGLKNGKSLNEIERMHSFWPDDDTVKNDLLDYAFEIEYFDQQIGEMLDLLEKNGELSNTIVIITSDNGMPFPRVKGQEYEFSNHLPLAIMWPKGILKTGRSIEDFVSLTDLAPTLLSEAAISPEIIAQMKMEGNSLSPYFEDHLNDNARNHVLVGKERHDVGRPGDVGYPIRGIISKEFIYLKNFFKNRWPAGNPETGYMNCDGSPTKTSVLNTIRLNPTKEWELCFGKRSGEELYRYKSDPDCIANLADIADYDETKQALLTKMVGQLRLQGDFRVLGKADEYEGYAYADSSTLHFYERYMAGENVQARWINESDIDTLESSKK